jgi:hypothetical protein
MFAKVSILFCGISFIALGRHLFFNRAYYDWDLGRIDIGPYHWAFGIIFMIGGIFFVYNAIRMIIRDKKKRRPPHKGN